MRAARVALAWLLGLFFAFAGVMHFVKADRYARIVPPYLPWPDVLVAVSGVAEVGLGLLLLVPRWRRPAAWGLVALLVAVFPANVHMALHPADFLDYFPNGLRQSAPGLLWARLPVQGLLIAAVWFTRPRPAS